MDLIEVRKLVAGTGDAAYALDHLGMITAWNESAAELFGIAAEEAIGNSCSGILQGVDECGRECSEDCPIVEHARLREPLKGYDIRLGVGREKRWYNVSVVIVEGSSKHEPYTMHVLRPADTQKRLEILMRDFVATETGLAKENVDGLLARKRSASSTIKLTDRETEILRMLATGNTTAEVAEKLFISRATANNHIQHFMKKLGAHTRLEAVRRAETSGLI